MRVLGGAAIASLVLVSTAVLAESPAAPGPCVIALPRVTSSARAKIESRCGSSDGRIHDGDDVALGARGHVRLEAPLEDGTLDVTCITSAPLSFTVKGDEAPWLASGAVTCGGWAHNERVCTSTATGDEVFVCDAIARAGKGPAAPAGRPLGLPSWYVGELERVEPGERARTTLDAATTTTTTTASDAAAGLERKRNVRVAVYELKASGVDERVAAVMTGSLVAELRKLANVTVIGMDEVKAMLDHEAEKQLLGCDDESCLSEIAESLGADTLLVGSLARIGDENVVALKRIDQRTASVAGHIDQRLKPENGEEFLAIVGPSVEALFPDFPLKPGRVRGVADEIALRLNPPPLDPWPFYVGLGVSGMAAAAAGAVSVVLLAEQAKFVEFQNTKSYSNGEYDARAEPIAALQTTMVALWITTGAVALTTAGLAPFTDFWGYRDASLAEAAQ